MKRNVIAAALAAAISLSAVPALAYEVGDVTYSSTEGLSDQSNLGGWSCSGSSCSRDFEGSRTEDRTVGYTATVSEQVIVRGSVLSCPWPKGSRYYPGYRRNVDPITCQSEYLGRSDGGSPIVRSFEVPTVTTVTKSLDPNPTGDRAHAWIITVTSVTTVDAP